MMPAMRAPPLSVCRSRCRPTRWLAFGRRLAQLREQAVGMIEQVDAFLDEDVDEFGVQVGQVECFVRILGRDASSLREQDARRARLAPQFGFGRSRSRVGFDAFGFEACGFGAFGFDAFGFDAFGFGAFGFGTFGFGTFGFGAFGFDAFGFGAFGFDAFGFGAFGFDAFGFGAFGFDAFGFGAFGFGAFGFDAFGFGDVRLRRARLRTLGFELRLGRSACSAFGFQARFGFVFGLGAFGFGAFGFRRVRLRARSASATFGFETLGFKTLVFGALGFETLRFERSASTRLRRRRRRSIRRRSASASSAALGFDRRSCVVDDSSASTARRFESDAGLEVAVRARHPRHRSAARRPLPRRRRLGTPVRSPYGTQVDRREVVGRTARDRPLRLRFRRFQSAGRSRRQPRFRQAVAQGRERGRRARSNAARAATADCNAADRRARGFSEFAPAPRRLRAVATACATSRRLM